MLVLVEALFKAAGLFKPPAPKLPTEVRGMGGGTRGRFKCPNCGYQAGGSLGWGWAEVGSIFKKMVRRVQYECRHCGYRWYWDFPERPR